MASNTGLEKSKVILPKREPFQALQLELQAERLKFSFTSLVLPP